VLLLAAAAVSAAVEMKAGSGCEPIITQRPVTSDRGGSTLAARRGQKVTAACKATAYNMPTLVRTRRSSVYSAGTPSAPTLKLQRLQEVQNTGNKQWRIDSVVGFIIVSG